MTAITSVGAFAAEEVWIGPKGNWSDGTKWLDGSAPAPGGDANLTLRFTSPTGTATFLDALTLNNLGDPFSLNRLVFDSYNGQIVINGSGLRLTGDSPQIVLRGSGRAYTAAPLMLDSTAGAVSITGSGSGNFDIQTFLAQANGAQSLVIECQPSSFNSQLIRLYGTITVDGGVTLKSGNLVLSRGGSNLRPLGNAPLFVHGGTLRMESALQLPNDIQLHDDLVVAGASDSTLSGVISSAAPNTGVVLRTNTTGRTLKLSAASTYEGPTRIDYGPVSTTPYFPAGVLHYTGDGSARHTSLFDIRSEGTLQIDGTAEGNGNRINDAAPVELHGGRLAFNAVPGAEMQTEQIGVLRIGGESAVAATASASTNVRLVADRLERLDRGTVVFRGTNLGQSPGPNVSNILFTNAPTDMVGGDGTGPATSILPYALGDLNPTGSGTGFVTYDSVAGVRPLDLSTEYDASLPAAASTHNVRLTSPVIHAGEATINSLILAGGSLTGGGQLHVTSGAVLSTMAGTRIENALTFGEAEGNISVAFSTTLTIAAPITGSGGLTKGGSGTLLLQADNPFTGPLTINGGIVSFSALRQLGADQSPIHIGKQLAGLRFGGAGTISLARDIVTSSGFADLSGNSAGTLQIDGAISGPGAVRVDAGNVRLMAPNSFGGDVFISGSGRLEIASDAALGLGSEITFNGFTSGTLGLLGPWSSSRTMRIIGLGKIDTGSFDAHWTAPVLGILPTSGSTIPSIEKYGSGTLNLTAESPFEGYVTIRDGTLRLKDAGLLHASLYSVEGNGRLLLDNGDSAVPNRIQDSSKILIAGGEFVLTGNASANITERVAELGYGVHTSGFNVIRDGGAVTLQAVGEHGTILSVGKFLGPGNGLIIRGDNLSGGAGEPFTRVVFSNPPSHTGGILRSVYVGTSASGLPTSFGVYDSAMDAHGPVGVRPLRPSEYVQGGVIQNPDNGGTTSTTGNFLVSQNTTSSGTQNTVNSLTLSNGSSLSLAAGQTLAIASGGLLVQPGSSLSTVEAGIIDFGTLPGIIATFGDLQVNSVLSASGGLRKGGPGTLTLSADPLSADTGGILGDLSVQDGTFAFRGEIGSAKVSVNSGATLTGEGRLTGSVSISGRLSPGGEGGELHVGQVTFNSGASLALDLFAATEYDRLSVDGVAALGRSIALELGIAPGFDPLDGVDRFTLISNEGTGAVLVGDTHHFVFWGMPLLEGSQFSVGNQPFQMSYAGGDGNDVVLYAVPEPTMGALFITGLITLISRRQRRVLPLRRD